MEVVTLGPEGTYSHRAARLISDEVDFLESITSIVGTVTDGEYERAVIPIENSIEGSVTESLDALADHEVAVLKEIITPINHVVLGRDPEFSTIASHSQAIAQCRDYLHSEHSDVSIRTVSSTAHAVELAREDPSVAAIAHPSNADGDDSMTIFSENVQSQSSNATRFFVLGPTSDRDEVGTKSSVIIYPARNYPGLLIELLTPFAERDINLTRVDARPSGKRLGDYVIHVDISASYYQDRTERAIDQVTEQVEDGWVRWLGSYDVEHASY